MTIKAILPFGDPILRKKARPVETVDARILKLLSDMADTLYESEGRAGLAAPQIGILRRVIVMDCGDGLIELVNPEILSMEGEQTGAESCLSFPGYYGRVKRAEKVTVRSLNRAGESVIFHGEGFLARCMQHEIDHLDGVLFIDHMKERWLVHEHTQERIELLPVLRLSHVAHSG
ncbi:peptide deformylase [Paenibacillus algorifonticola]|uniref:Peptide deformylase n=1 Tax=Paenibacillus algorifonticola TaxID=684063 RepID=A0A1I1YQK7_9BACL|nr:peptide deformylase [Paenibacillus algorifonticola]SFE21729.1 peptide deformylase [Paenibacillus algorifonticola]